MNHIYNEDEKKETTKKTMNDIQESKRKAKLILRIHQTTIHSYSFNNTGNDIT